mgnify:CR=1 FL=1
MANKYSDYDKFMLSFTIPTAKRAKTIKNGRYTKLRELIKIRAYIAKLISNHFDVKYFMNIELGKAYSNPHIHVQLWIKNTTSANTANQILNKTVSNFNLNKNRCILTEPEQAIPVYNYVIKDYAKDLTDDELWNLETQKKRMRKHLGSAVRFYTKSTDRFTKRIYRIMYYSYGVVRDKANDYLDFFINNFFYFSKKRGVKVSLFICLFSKLGNKEQERNLFDSFVFIVEVFSFAPGHDPPKLCIFLTSGKWFLDCKQKIYFKGVTMYVFCFTRVFLFRSFLFFYDLRIGSPPCFIGYL